MPNFEQPYLVRAKPITMPSKKPQEVQSRDTFQTPKYATELLVPFIPKHIKWIWECAAGDGRISNVLSGHGFGVFSSDLKERTYNDGTIDIIQPSINFLTEKCPEQPQCIITNPPFSIKDDFIEKAFSYKVPFAFLINADYSGQTIDWIKRGCEKIVPTSRIAYITPNILRRIHEGEIWKAVYKEFITYDSLDELKYNEPNIWEDVMNQYQRFHNYKSIDETPQELLYKYSSAQFHSMWLTYGFNLGRTETFVDLTVEQRKTNI